MSGMASYTPGMEISGGSLGHGLAVATGMALGLRHQGTAARVFNLLSDGELDEGSTWEAALGCPPRAGQPHRDRRRQRPAGRRPDRRRAAHRAGPDKWLAFGWHALRVDGNDIAALVDAFDELARASRGSPAVVICDTRIGRGVPLLETREKAHFMRVADRRVADRPRPARRPDDEGCTAHSTTATALTTSAMIASFADPGQRTTSAPFGHALATLAEERPEIVGLSADLAKYTDMHVFRDAHPDRFFQMGMAEQGCSAPPPGLAEVGLVPFASTYSVFATRRAYDFLCLDIAEPGLNVNVVGALPGLTTGYGPSHQATEDLAILRGCPDLTIVDPCDCGRHRAGRARSCADHAGPTYLRLLRGAVPTVLDEYDYRFELGKAAELRTGRDVVLISTGLMTMRALQAAARLEADHVDVAVLHVPTIKPLDREAILRAAGPTGSSSRCENHTVIGGLAESVASPRSSAAGRQAACPIALPDEFLAAGALPTLHDRYGLSTARSSPPCSPSCSVVVDIQVLTIQERRCRSNPSLLRLEKTSLREQALSALRRAITTGQLTAWHAPRRDRVVGGAADQSRHVARGHAPTPAGGSDLRGGRGRLSVRHLDTKEIRDMFDVRAALRVARRPVNWRRAPTARRYRRRCGMRSRTWTSGRLQSRGPHRGRLRFHRTMCDLTGNETLLHRGHRWRAASGCRSCSRAWTGR